MKSPSLLSDIGSLMKMTGEALADNYKTTAFVSAYSFAAGLSAFLDWFTTALPTLAIFAGFLGALVLAHLNWKKSKLTDLEARKLEAELEYTKLNTRRLREEIRSKGNEVRQEDKLL